MFENSVEDYLRHGESISDSSVEITEHGTVGVHTVERAGLRSGDEVLLDIVGNSEPLVLIGGNAARIEVQTGWGLLTIMDLCDPAVQDHVQLRTNDTYRIPSTNSVYWYSADSDQNWIIRDRCTGFESKFEPTAQQVVDALSTALTTTWVNLGK